MAEEVSDLDEVRSEYSDDFEIPLPTVKASSESTDAFIPTVNTDNQSSEGPGQKLYDFNLGSEEPPDFVSPLAAVADKSFLSTIPAKNTTVANPAGQLQESTAVDNVPGSLVAEKHQVLFGGVEKQPKSQHERDLEAFDGLTSNEGVSNDVDRAAESDTTMKYDIVTKKPHSMSEKLLEIPQLNPDHLKKAGQFVLPTDTPIFTPRTTVSADPFDGLNAESSWKRPVPAKRSGAVSVPNQTGEDKRPDPKPRRSVKGRESTHKDISQNSMESAKVKSMQTAEDETDFPQEVKPRLLSPVTAPTKKRQTSKKAATPCIPEIISDATRRSHGIHAEKKVTEKLYAKEQSPSKHHVTSRILAVKDRKYSPGSQLSTKESPDENNVQRASDYEMPRTRKSKADPDIPQGKRLSTTKVKNSAAITRPMNATFTVTPPELQQRIQGLTLRQRQLTVRHPKFPKKKKSLMSTAIRFDSQPSKDALRLTYPAQPVADSETTDEEMNPFLQRLVDFTVNDVEHSPADSYERFLLGENGLLHAAAKQKQKMHFQTMSQVMHGPILKSSRCLLKQYDRILLESIEPMLPLIRDPAHISNERLAVLQSTKLQIAGSAPGKKGPNAQPAAMHHDFSSARSDVGNHEKEQYGPPSWLKTTDTLQKTEQHAVLTNLSSGAELEMKNRILQRLAELRDFSPESLREVSKGHQSTVIENQISINGHLQVITNYFDNFVQSNSSGSMSAKQVAAILTDIFDSMVVV